MHRPEPIPEECVPGLDAAPFDATACVVEAWSVVRLPVEEVLSLRKGPGPARAPGARIAPSLLKHADHQTLLALAAVLRAAERAGWSAEGRSYADWGLIAAPRFLGRIIAAGAMDRFTRAGVPGVSPLIIPTLSLHAVAGSLSLAMGSHGFNYGVGGGPGHLAEALMAGLAARDDQGVPGVWVVATGFDPEPVPDVSGHSLTPSTGHAVALALTAATDPSRARLNLRLVPTAPSDPAPRRAVSIDDTGGEPLEGLAALADFLEPAAPGPVARPRRWYLPLPGGGAVELDDDPARAAGLADGAARAG